MRIHPALIHSATLENVLATNSKNNANNNANNNNSINNTVAVEEKVPTADHTTTYSNPPDFNEATSSNYTTPPPLTYKSSSPPSSKTTTVPNLPRKDIALPKLPMARKYPTYPIVKCICINLMG